MSESRSRRSHRNSIFRESSSTGDKNSIYKRNNSLFWPELRPEILPEEVKEVAEVDETDSENGNIDNSSIRIQLKDANNKGHFRVQSVGSIALSPYRNPFSI